jgi:hypothetical protein
LNDNGIYEYAKVDKEGVLKPSGTRASNPENRERREERFLGRTKKHLRYQPPKLDEIMNKSFHNFYERQN